MSGILIHVEDPGAANFVLGLPDRLEARFCRTSLYASAHAKAYLSDRGQSYKDVQEDAETVLGRESPSLVVVGTSEDPDAFSLSLTDAARHHGLPTVGLVDMVCNADRRFRGRTSHPLAYAPDHLVLPDVASADAYRALGMPTNKLVVLGHPLYDRIWERRRYCDAAGRNEARVRPRLLFVAEGWDLLNPSASRRSHDYTLHGRNDNDWRTAIVLQELLDAVGNLPEPRPEVVVRLHPKSDPKDFVPFAEEITLESDGDPLDAIWRSDAVIGMASMLLVEAAILGLPVLSVLPRETERAWLGPLLVGDIPVVTSRDALRSTLPRLLAGQLFPSNPAKWAAPGAAERIADHLATLQ